jgi:hypothetical protein
MPDEQNFWRKDSGSGFMKYFGLAAISCQLSANVIKLSVYSAGKPNMVQLLVVS